MTKLCYVTAFLNIGRDDWTQFSRSVDNYVNAFLPYVKLFENNPSSDHEMVVYIDERMYDDLREKIPEELPITMIKINEEFLHEHMPMWSRLSREREIMESEHFKQMIGERIKYPEANNPKYTLINHIKIDFVVHALTHYTQAEFLCWSDFGYFQLENRIPDTLIDTTKLYPDQINYTLINPLEDIDNDVYYTLKNAPERVGGFFFAGKRDKLVEYQELYHKIHQWLQDNGIVDDDQAMVLQCRCSQPDLFVFHQLGGWHLALLHFQKNIPNNPEMYSIILPIKVTSGNGYRLFCDFGLKSYEKYLDITNLYAFYIIAPANEIPFVEKFTKGSKIPFKYIPDEDILDPTLVIDGWFKQQIIKLRMAEYVQTEHYLVIDSDLYLTQTLTYEDLFHEGKLKYNSEPWQTENGMHYSQNSNWWEASCSYLNYPVDQLYGEKHLMSVTPETLRKQSVLKLLGYFHTLNGNNWQKVVCDAKCTEFTLYWLYMLASNTADKYYTHKGFPLWKHNLTHNVVDYSNASVDVVRNSFITPQSYFGVIQGYLNIDLTPLIQEGVRCLNRPEIDAVIIMAAMLKPLRYQFFSTADRHRQALETVQSARKNIPSSVCVFIEGSPLEPEQEKDYRDACDHVILTAGNLEVDECVNNPTNIGFGECKLLHIALMYIKEHVLPYYKPKYIIKLGCRYTLNDKFDLSKYNPDMFNFCQRYDKYVNRDVIVTSLYSFPPRYFYVFENMMANSGTTLTKHGMVETMYHDEMPAELINRLDMLGIQGQLSYNGHHFQH